MPLTLLIDTAFESCQVALAQGEKIIAQQIQTGGGGQDRVLAGMVRDVLASQNITVKELQKIAVTTGPGRFTGLRVGIAFARGLALVNKTPLVGIVTTDVLALDLADASSDKNNLAVLLSVKRGESFVQRVKPMPTDIVRVMDDELNDHLMKSGPVTIGGFISPATRAMLNSEITVLDGLDAPSLTHMAGLAALMNALPNVPVRPYYGT